MLNKNNNKGWNLKKYFLLTVCLILFYAALIAPPVSANEPITLKVGAYENPPKIFTDDTGKVSGFWPDIVNYIALQEGWKIEWVWCIWSQCMDKLENNEIDLMPDVGFTESRSKKYAFSKEIVLVSWSRLYARKDSGIETILDLEGKKIGALVGSFNLQGPEGIKELTEKFGLDCTFVEMNNYTEVFKSLENREVDAGVTNKDFGNKYEKDFNIERTPIIFQPSHMQFAFPKNSNLTPYLLEKVDYHMKELKKSKDSIYYQSLEKWFGVRYPEKPVIPRWIYYILIVVGGIALLLFGGNFILRSQVRSKTKELRLDITKRKQAEEKLRESYQRLKKTIDATLDTMSKIIEAKDPYTSGHQHRVCQLAVPLARELGLSPDKIEGIRIASLIHDIGKIGVPAEILSKTTTLSNIEFSLIKEHSQIGYDILKSIDFSYPIAEIVLQHHERLNGSGYPNNLKGDKILLEAKIIGVADVVEAMSSHRPYRPALGIDAALEEISKNKGILYDPEVVDACIKLFKEKGFKFE